MSQDESDSPVESSVNPPWVRTHCIIAGFCLSLNTLFTPAMVLQMNKLVYEPELADPRARGGVSRMLAHPLGPISFIFTQGWGKIIGWHLHLWDWRPFLLGLEILVSSLARNNYLLLS